MKHIINWLKLAILFIITTIYSTTVHAGTGAGYSEYYVPGSEQQIYDTLHDIRPTNVTDNTQMHAVISVVAIADNTIIYYDHWENGYGMDISDPASTADFSVTLQKGESIVFESNEISTTHTGVNDCTVVNGPAGESASACYDGGDRFFTTGGPVTVNRASWNDQTSTYFQMAWEVYPTKALDNDYIVPFGQDISGAYPDFKRSYVLAMATEDSTSVSLNGGASTTINKGETVSIMNNNTGATVSADKPMYVMSVVGDQDATYESRGFTMVPRSNWTDSYYGPAGSTDVNGDQSKGMAEVYIYNPQATDITISYEDKDGSGTFTVAAGQTEAFSDAGNANRLVAVDSAIYLQGSADFWGITSVDTESSSWDWGHSLIPDTYLKSEYLIGWAPGSLDKTDNGSPLYITPVDDNTQVFIDFAPLDGVADLNYTLNRLDSQTVYDTTAPFEMTGARVYATGSIAIVWGEQAASGSSGENYMDMGYTTLPQRDDWIDLALTIEKTADKVLISAKAGETVRFTLTPQAYATRVAGVNIKDILPTGWSYVSGNTVITLQDGTIISGAGADPAVSGQNMIWDSSVLQDMNATKQIVIEYDATTTVDFTPGDASINQVEVNATSGSIIFSASDLYTNYFVGMDVEKTSTLQNTPLLPGDTIDYSIQITNSAAVGSPSILNDINVTDVFPLNTTLNSCTIEGYSYASIDVTEDFSVNNGSGGSNWDNNWTEINV